LSEKLYDADACLGLLVLRIGLNSLQMGEISRQRIAELIRADAHRASSDTTRVFVGMDFTISDRDIQRRLKYNLAVFIG
jgi:hypothetical protein